MLQDLDLTQTIDKQAFSILEDAMGQRLGQLQRQLHANGRPTLIIFHGWEAAGKGTCINRLLMHLDPRGFVVHSAKELDKLGSQRPFLWPYWLNTPIGGQITVLEDGWYSKLKISSVQSVQSIENFEQCLADDGVVILKFFLHVSQKEQKRRFQKLESSEETRWRIKKDDWKQNQDYPKNQKNFETLIKKSSFDFTPWILVPADDSRFASIAIFEKIIATWETATDPDLVLEGDENYQKAAAAKRKIGTATQAQRDHHAPYVPKGSHGTALYKLTSKSQVRKSTAPSKANASPPRLVAKNQVLDASEYKARFTKAQNRLQQLQFVLRKKKRPVVIVFEGLDAAGKGGAIRRLCSNLDPRGYRVIPIAAPDSHEIRHHYLWRFWRHVPQDGHLAIFDRSWYGRVLVERVEGFSDPEVWQRSYEEINRFEKNLVDHGTIICKFWLNVSPEEQLQRFEDRKGDPDKSWKLTEEDWRNREKRDDYEKAVDEMIGHCSPAIAPWHSIDADSKTFARLFTLETVIARIEAGL